MNPARSPLALLMAAAGVGFGLGALEPAAAELPQVPVVIGAEGVALDSAASDRQAPEAFELAQSRRRPGSAGPSRRDRRAPDSERIKAATTPEQAERNAEIYKDIIEVPPPPYDEEFVSVPDRWKMLYQGKWYDPYNQNVFKGDLRLFGTDAKPWFLEITAMSDSLIEQRAIPTAVGLQSNNNPDSINVFGDYNQTFYNQNFLFQTSIIRGNTTFRPQDFELRIGHLFNFNYIDTDESGVVRVDPARGTSRDDAHYTLLEAFIDYHLADVSHRYDFVSTRVGIQKFNADFRGFVYSDEQPGVRFFGNLDNNKYQWNAAWFSRLEKDANALLNKLFETREEDVFIANLYRQDLLALGHDVQLIYIYRADTYGDGKANFDENGALTSPPPLGDERGKNIYNSYVGLNTNGHFGRLNVNSSLYYAFGSESHNPISGKGTDINAFMAALELSVDIDWFRPKMSFFWASGDDDPFDGDAEGFDAIFDNPNFVGGDFTYWQRQGIPLIAGGGAVLTDRLCLLPDLRAGKAQGQSNFINPGIFIYHIGLDVDVTPKLLWFNNASYLRFDSTETLQVLRQDGSIDEEIGYDLSTGFLYRPFLNNNIQLRAGAAALFPGDGLDNLYKEHTLYSLFSQFILLY